MKRKNLKSMATLLVMASIITNCLMMGADAAGAESFSDVPAAFWAYTYVEEACTKGFISGVGGGLFAPEQEVTYAQFATMLVRGFFNSDYLAYGGVSEPWYIPFCEVASNLGLFDGTICYKTESGWDAALAPINRYEMALMMYNTLKTRNVDMPSSSDRQLSAQKIADHSQIPSNYTYVVECAVSLGTLTGIDSNGTFAGSEYMTRAQAAVVMCKLSSLL